MELSQKFKITDEGEIDEYLGVKVQRNNDRRFELSRPLLIEQILTALGFNECTKPKTAPALFSKILERDEDGLDHETAWDYWSIIGRLKFLEKLSRPDIAYAVHQCTRFAENPGPVITCNTKNWKVPDADQKHRTDNAAKQQSAGALVLC